MIFAKAPLCQNMWLSDFLSCALPSVFLCETVINGHLLSNYDRQERMCLGQETVKM